MMCRGEFRTHASIPRTQPTARSAPLPAAMAAAGTLLLADLSPIDVMMCSSGINGFAAANAVAQNPSTMLLHSQRWVLKTAH